MHVLEAIESSTVVEHTFPSNSDDAILADQNEIAMTLVQLNGGEAKL
jgi:hypothetical protein